MLSNQMSIISLGSRLLCPPLGHLYVYTSGLLQLCDHLLLSPLSSDARCMLSLLLLQKPYWYTRVSILSALGPDHKNKGCLFSITWNIFLSDNFLVIFRNALGGSSCQETLCTSGSPISPFWSSTPIWVSLLTLVPPSVSFSLYSDFITTAWPHYRLMAKIVALDFQIKKKII